MSNVLLREKVKKCACGEHLIHIGFIVKFIHIWQLFCRKKETFLFKCFLIVSQNVPLFQLHTYSIFLLWKVQLFFVLIMETTTRILYYSLVGPHDRWITHLTKCSFQSWISLPYPWKGDNSKIWDCNQYIYIYFMKKNKTPTKHWSVSLWKTPIYLLWLKELVLHSFTNRLHIVWKLCPR